MWHLLAKLSGAAGRRRAEEALRGQSEFFRAVTDNATTAIFMHDTEGRCTFMNPAAEAMTGYSLREARGRLLHDLIHHTRPDGTPFPIAECLISRATRAGAELREHADVFVRRDGTLFPVRIASRPVVKAGAVSGFVVEVRDVTEGGKAERALRESEARFRATFEQAAVGMAHVGLDGRWLLVNDRLCDIVGYGRDELLARTFQDITHPDDLDADLENVRGLLAGELTTYSMPKRYFRKGGELVWINLTVSLVRDGGGRPQHFISVVEDVTARRRAEEALREGEARFRAAFEQAAVGMARVGLDGRWLLVNDRLCDIVGFGRDELLARTFQDITHPDDLGPNLENMRGLLSGGRANYSMPKRYVRKDGSAVWVNLTATLVRDAAGRPLDFISVIEDITVRRRAEEALRQAHDVLEKRVRERTAELERSNRELQDFAFVASHDLQEPLRKIQGFGELLRAEYGAALGAEGCDYVARMTKAAGRMRQLISDLLALSRVTTRGRPFVAVDLGELAGAVVADLEHRLRETGGRVEVGELPTVEADATQMRQLLQNLIGNALKFHRKGAAPFVVLRGEVVPGTGSAEARVTVEDNGIGFEDKHSEKVFEMFQRLHGRGDYEGTGMGLAICRKIVERHGGAITARGRPGEGAAFVITLPLRQPRGRDVP